jgi:hypothetical protein
MKLLNIHSAKYTCIHFSLYCLYLVKRQLDCFLLVELVKLVYLFLSCI